MRAHHEFEILCAVAASGQASEEELQALQEHTDRCPECRHRLVDLAQVSAQALQPVVSRKNRVAIPAGMEARFRARALAEGVPLSNPNGCPDPFPDPCVEETRSLRSLNFLGASVAALLLFLVITGAIARRMHAPPLPEVSSATVPSVRCADSPVAEAPRLVASRHTPRARSKVAKRKAGLVLAVAPSHQFIAAPGVLQFRPVVQTSNLPYTVRWSVDLSPKIALKPSLTASIASLSSMQAPGLFLPAAFEVYPAPRVFHFQPSTDSSTGQPVNALQNVDWRQYWNSRDERFAGSSATSAQ